MRDAAKDPSNFDDRPTPEGMLQREAAMMGQPVEYVNFWETFFTTTDGVEHLASMLIYRCLPVEVAGVTIHQARFAVYTDGKPSAGGVI